jgi:hypothetical protein
MFCGPREAHVSTFHCRSTICQRNVEIFRRAGAGVQLGQVAIYCRVSTDDQSCERQERDLRAFARRAGHKIVAVFME